MARQTIRQRDALRNLETRELDAARRWDTPRQLAGGTLTELHPERRTILQWLDERAGPIVLGCIFGFVGGVIFDTAMWHSVVQP